MASTNLIGVPGHAAPSPCFSWCDHGDRYPGEHESTQAALSFPSISGLNMPAHPLGTASLYSSGQFRAPRVSVDLFDEDGPVFGVCLPPEAAEEFADRLIAFASQIRTLARRTSA